MFQTRSYPTFRALFALASILVASIIAPQVIQAQFEEKPSANIEIRGDALYYRGTTSVANYILLLETIAKNPKAKITTLIINSNGGHTFGGRKIGAFVFERQLDVEVETICFSSCANYIFPAGKEKRIQARAVVGWHGSDHQ